MCGDGVEGPRVGNGEGDADGDIENPLAYRHWVLCKRVLGDFASQASSVREVDFEEISRQDNVDLRGVEGETMMVEKPHHKDLILHQHQCAS